MPERLTPAPPTPERTELLAKMLHSANGKPLNVFTVLAHNTTVLRRLGALGGTLTNSGRIGPVDRETVILRVSARLGCDYEWHHHIGQGRDAGLSDEDIGRLREEISVTGGRLGLLATMTDEVLDGGGFADTTWARLRSTFHDEQLVELIVLVGFYQLLAAFIRSAGVPVDESGARP
ncbi:MAG: hypothetical protein GEV28_06665 [Actinophytocola sp.]|uniref:carboxymuconolactone decarboxylase family protein n=1 Tax=Actinophytocola sp. TaxID=1872138 RepID=UPI00132A77CC|nr:carboxymuconolactone decarboxylase family protein [Actinophytocola sp.]MPZ80078.1 hypothetical protein [Actinophytocola sp.]